MSGTDLAIIAAALVGYGLFSRRLAGTWLSPAMAFLAVGVVVGVEGLDLLDVGAESSVLKLLAEATLAFVLFSDASKLDLRALVRTAGLPVRLLGVGLPLTILAGAVAAAALIPDLELVEAVVLAVLLAPTDAALGQAVVSDERLPGELRQGLNVESGLNDGICVPLLFAAIAVAEIEEGGPSVTAGEVLTDLVKEIGIAGLVGVGVALVVALLRNASAGRGWLDGRWARIVPLAATALAYTLTVELGGSGFIGSFVAGIVYGARVDAAGEEQIDLIEEVGALFSAATFLLFAALLVGPAFQDLDAAVLGYAVLSLTVVRMAPVALALVGSGERSPTVAFAGWFGPRGLATIVFALTVVEESGLAGTRTIVQVATVTVALSIVAHGVTAPWLTSRYTAWLDRQQTALDSA